MPGLDVSVPVSVGYNISGRSSVIQSQTEGAGNFEIGLAATYRAVWTASVKVTSYFGAPTKQAFADRDFLSISVARTF